MFSTPILDVAIGLSLFYLLLGLICTTVTEMIAGWRNTRGKFLAMGVQRLLGDDPELQRKLYAHPLIAALGPGGTANQPSYIPADKFAKALLDIISGDKPLTDTAAIREQLKTIGNPAVRRSLTTLLDTAQDNGAVLRKEVEDWFNHGMDRVTGWYKRNAQRNALILASVVTLVLNADTISVARVLWTNPAVRANLVEQARTRGAMARPEEFPAVEYANSSDATASTPIPVSSAEALSPDEQNLLGGLTGWGEDRKKFENAEPVSALAGIVGNHIIGWIITALAVSLGAPFWFDTLGRFINLRNAGRPPDTGGKNPSAGAAPSGATPGGQTV